MEIADVICWRTVLSGKLRLLIATMDSSLDSASRGSVRVNCRHGTFVTGVHGLQHVEGFFSTHFADDDAVGAHAQAVDQ